MPTPDGISDANWNRIHELALLLLKHADDKTKPRYRRRLLSCLDRLEKKYGLLPSILATRADFISNSRQQEKLFLRAYCLAKSRHDGTNLLYVSHSLAELYVENLKNVVKSGKWLRIFNEHLAETPAIPGSTKSMTVCGSYPSMSVDPLPKGG